MIRFFAGGLAAPKGSKRVVTRGRGGVVLPFARVLDDSPHTKAWASIVAWHARQAIARERVAPYRDIPLEVGIVFGFHRPRSHHGSGRNVYSVKESAPRAPCVKPDIDKLARSTLDAMTGILFDDDARITQLVATKIYIPLGVETGALICVQPASWAQLEAAGDLYGAFTTREDGGR